MINAFKNLFLVTLFMSTSALAEGNWFTSIDEGVRETKTEGKLVMVKFTDPDFCPPCIMMNKKVFSKKEFIDQAQKNYVLVKLDAPRADHVLERSTKKLMEKYKVMGFPTILLLDSVGKEFKRFTASENPLSKRISQAPHHRKAPHKYDIV